MLKNKLPIDSAHVKHVPGIYAQNKFIIANVPRASGPNTPVTTTFGRFTTDVENFHGRIAMLGMTGCAFDETIQRIPVVQQLVTETGLTSLQITAIVTVITAAFILETINPSSDRRTEKELAVFSKPGFTLETEIFHGRMAMLAFAYTVIGEQVSNRLLL